jgi:hypothetical protein
LNRKDLPPAPALAILILGANWDAKSDDDQLPVSELDKQIEKNVRQTLNKGRQVFRFDTFGDESSGAIRLGCIKPSRARGSAACAGEILDMMSER